MCDTCDEGESVTMSSAKESIWRKLIKSGSKAIASLGIGTLTTSVPIETISESVTDVAIDVILEKYDAIQEKKKTNVSVVCHELIPPDLRKWEPMLITNAEICMEHLDLFQGSFSAREKAEELSYSFLRRYQKQFSEKEYGFLSKQLPRILRETIYNTQITLETDSEFQISFKEYITDTLSAHEARLSNHEIRITKIEHEPRIVLESPVTESFDVDRQVWNEKMFLRDYALLSDVYQPPHYVGKDDRKPQCDIKERLERAANLCYDIDERMLVILGQPGSGKSTLITYFLNKCMVSKDRKIRVYHLKNFEHVDWEGSCENLPDVLLMQAGLVFEDLNNSILFLDGLDEVNLRGQYCAFLNALYDKWANSSQLTRFTLFVTCRINRIENELDELDSPYIMLCPLSSKQISDFSEAYKEKNKGCTVCFPEDILNKDEDIFPFSEDILDRDEDTLSNVLGIPLILYLVLGLNIEIDSATSMADVYDKIFSISDTKHSIYYRPYKTKNKKLPLLPAKITDTFSKRIAIEMWKFHPQEAIVDAKNYCKIVEQIAQNIGSDEDPNIQEFKDVELHDLLSEQYFVEGAVNHELYFVHRSMYEYFVAAAIFDTILQLYSSERTPAQLFKNIEESNNVLTPFANLIGIESLDDYDIMPYLNHMLQGSQEKISDTWWNEFLEEFLHCGLADVALECHRGGSNGIKEETSRCRNIICIAKEIQKLLGHEAPFRIITSCSSVEELGYYSQIPHNSILSDLFDEIELKTIDLRGAHLEDARLGAVYLEGADLEGAYLICADLKGAQLTGAHLEGADLEGADLEGAYLDFAYLEGAHLEGAHLDSAYLEGAHLEGAHLEGAHLEGAHLEYADLEGADLRNAN